VGVILLDLDYFKRINDQLGHLAGDAVLQEAVKRMNACVRPYDVIGRYGGEEFLIVVPSTDAMGALGEAERVRVCLEQKIFETSAGSIAITASFGVAAADQILPAKYLGPIDPKILLAASDAALYRAKRHGRNRVEIATAADFAGTKVSEPSRHELQEENQK